MIDIQARVIALSGGDISCLTCSSRSGNWMVDLQDLLEDLGIPVEKFCNTDFPYCARPFMTKRGRLRLNHATQCINREYLITMLMALTERLNLNLE